MGVLHTHSSSDDCAHDCCCHAADAQQSSDTECDETCALCEFLHTAFVPAQPLALPVPVVELQAFPIYFIAHETMASTDVITLRGPPAL